MRRLLFLALLFVSTLSVNASYLIIDMTEEDQRDHLKAYGIAFWALEQGLEVDWLLNYNGGSFALKYLKPLESECLTRGVSYRVIADGQYTAILSEIASPEKNMDMVKLEKAPKIAVYTPADKPRHPDLPWDDAVTLALEYAEIPFEKIYDEEVLDGKLPEYDWLHLHHEDFTGQYGRFYRSYRSQPWYQSQVEYEEDKAKRLGYAKVSEMKLDVVHHIRDYVIGGGFMFAMCSATDTYDIALAAEGVDICDRMFDGDGPHKHADSKLDFDQTMAFENFTLRMNPMEYEFSSIDATDLRVKVPESLDFFTLFEFSAKWDPVPTMLTQNHYQVIKGFMGQTTSYRKDLIKSNILVLGESKSTGDAKYIHSPIGFGFFTFYGGHDPEDYRHLVGEEATDLSLHPNSPGYRLILNNVLFPAAKKRKQKT
ncbi:hypothetical protein N8482_02550 [Chitinophagales bacterium]|nr:hypothetical protein [Chitinophagales bacterium]